MVTIFGKANTVYSTFTFNLPCQLFLTQFHFQNKAKCNFANFIIYITLWHIAQSCQLHTQINFSIVHLVLLLTTILKLE